MATQRDLDHERSSDTDARHHLLASFTEVEQARRAVEQLERAGIPAECVSMLGRDDERIATRADSHAQDRYVGKRFELSAAAGTLLGAFVGALLGFIGGGIAWGFPGFDADVGGLWTAVVGGAAGGAAVGFTLGGVARLQSSESWEQAYASVEEGRVVVGVHTDDAGEMEHAAAVLERGDPFSLTRYDDAGGRPLHGPGRTTG